MEFCCEDREFGLGNLGLDEGGSDVFEGKRGERKFRRDEVEAMAKA